MKRAPIILAGTVAGVVGIVGYHTATPSTAAGVAASTVLSSSAASTTASSTTASAKTTTSSAPTTATSATRTVTGEDVSYRYGDLELKVTRSGGRIENITVVKLDETDPRSQQIDQIAIPQLRQEAISAQSAKINGVSGASYTSAAYEQSLQAALDKLA
jgi:uncharacterized protein with FMN-binding domain